MRERISTPVPARVHEEPDGGRARCCARPTGLGGCLRAYIRRLRESVAARARRQLAGRKLIDWYWPAAANTHRRDDPRTAGRLNVRSTSDHRLAYACVRACARGPPRTIRTGTARVRVRVTRRKSAGEHMARAA
jgi:hypothetical protein